MSIRKNVKILHKFFKKIGLTYDFNEEEHLFSSGVQLENGIGNIGIHLSVQDDFVVCVSEMPQSATEDLRDAVAELVCRVNERMLFGQFGLDFDDGKLRFTQVMSSVELADSPMKNAERLVCDSHATVILYAPAFLKVMMGVCTPQTALNGEGGAVKDDGDGGSDEKPTPAASPKRKADAKEAEGAKEAAGAKKSKAAKESGSVKGEKGAKDEENGKPSPNGVSLVRDYRLDGLSIKGDIPLGKIVAAVRNFQKAQTTEGASALPDRPRMSLLLWGPPGTGKTEFVNYLGQQLDCEVLVKMAGDIADHYVGKTEKAIRAAFREAERKNAILFLDELDGLLQKRTDVSLAWEVTQVNELLACMECFGGVMVGATNLMDRLDPAVLRRFTYKVEFGYLENEGKRIFFDRAFRSSLADGEVRRLEAIPNLAPGDFKTVSQKLFYLGDGIGNAERLAALEQEVAIKPAGPRVCHGFAA